MKTFISHFVYAILFIFIIFTNSCKSKKTEKALNDIHYFNDYIKDYYNNNQVCVDSFNELYNPLKVYNLNDSNIVFISGYKLDNYNLLYITSDSIRIYQAQILDNPLGFFVFKTESITDTGFVSFVKYANTKMRFHYKCVFPGYYVKLFGLSFDGMNAFVLHFNDNRSIALCCSFTYSKTIKNNYIKIGKTHFVNTWPSNDSSIRTVVIPNFFPHNQDKPHN